MLMHQALVMDVEAGVPPMKAIQAATLNVARTFRKDQDYGSVYTKPDETDTRSISSFYSYQSLPLDLEIAPLFLIEGSGPTTLRVRGHGGMWPFHRVMLNGEPLPTSFVSKDEIKATISPEAIPKAGTYVVTLKCEGESFPESHRAHLVVGFKPQ